MEKGSSGVVERATAKYGLVDVNERHPTLAAKGHSLMKSTYSRTTFEVPYSSSWIIGSSIWIYFVAVPTTSARQETQAYLVARFYLPIRPVDWLYLNGYLAFQVLSSTHPPTVSLSPPPALSLTNEYRIQSPTWNASTPTCLPLVSHFGLQTTSAVSL